jgi:hypothetical protein
MGLHGTEHVQVNSQLRVNLAQSREILAILRL